jgi:hypothetical protein
MTLVRSTVTVAKVFRPVGASSYRRLPSLRCLSGFPRRFFRSYAARFTVGGRMDQVFQALIAGRAPGWICVPSKRFWAIGAVPGHARAVQYDGSIIAIAESRV